MNNITPEWIKTYKQDEGWHRLSSEIVNSTKQGSEHNIPQKIGNFIINVQSLERTIRLIISIIDTYHSMHKLSLNGKPYAVYRRKDTLEVPLGKLIQQLSHLRIKQGYDDEDLLYELKNKLQLFVKDRNYYVHNMFSKTVNQTIEQFKDKLDTKIEELSELMEESEKILGLVVVLYKLDEKESNIIIRHRNGISNGVKITKLKKND